MSHKSSWLLSGPILAMPKSEVVVEGHVAPGFESVRDMFEQNLARGAEKCAQLCVYVAGQIVIDICGHIHDDNDAKVLSPTSLLPVFSSTKSLTALVMACLMDRCSNVDYGTRVVEIWPEFGRHNKSDITIADVLRHEAGLVSFCRTIRLEDTFKESIKTNVIGSVIEESLSSFPPRLAGTKREYHSVTRGLILNEIFRRVDPQNRTMGEFVREEIALLLNIDVHIGGLSSTEIENVHNITCWSIPSVMLQSFVPFSLGRRIEPHWVDFSKIMRGFLSNRTIKFKDREHRRTRAKRVEVIQGIGNMRKPQAFLEFFESKAFRTGEIPSLNGFCSARGLARLGAVVVNKGLDAESGHRIISENGIKRMHEEFRVARDFGLPDINTCFSQGGVNQYKVCPGDSGPSRKSKSLRAGFIGWIGINGSVFQWNPDLKISFAYAPGLVHWYDSGNVLAGKLQAEVVKCVANIQNGQLK